MPNMKDSKKSIQELYDYLNETEGPDDLFIEQVKRNVVDWLFQHIKTFDRSVAEYIHLHDNSERVIDNTDIFHHSCYTIFQITFCRD